MEKIIDGFTALKLIHCKNPEYPRESYTIGFKYRGEKYSLSLTEPITDKRIIIFLERVIDIMKTIKGVK